MTKTWLRISYFEYIVKYGAGAGGWILKKQTRLKGVDELDLKCSCRPPPMPYPPPTFISRGEHTSASGSIIANTITIALSQIYARALSALVKATTRGACANLWTKPTSMALTKHDRPSDQSDDRLQKWEPCGGADCP